MRVRASDYATRARWRSSTAKAEGMACACPSEELCFGEEGVVNDIAAKATPSNRRKLESREQIADAWVSGCATGTSRTWVPNRSPATPTQNVHRQLRKLRCPQRKISGRRRRHTPGHTQNNKSNVGSTSSSEEAGAFFLKCFLPLRVMCRRRPAFDQFFGDNLFNQVSRVGVAGDLVFADPRCATGNLVDAAQ